MPKGIYTRKNGKNKTDAETPQKKGAKTRNRRAMLAHVDSFMSGYLLATFDVSHGIKRHPKQIARIAADGYKSGL